MRSPNHTFRFTPKAGIRPTPDRVEPYAMTTVANWGPTARVSAVERLEGSIRIGLLDSMGREHFTELSIIPDPEGAYRLLGDHRPLAVLVVARGPILDCGVIASSFGRIEVTAAQALGLAERGVHCVFRQ